jgi:hypothetical protein
MDWPTVLVAVAATAGADVPAFWEHPVVIAVGVVILGAVAGALASAYMNHRYWRKQQIYIEEHERERHAHIEEHERERQAHIEEHEREREQ